MAIATEVQSLNDIQYKSKIKILILIIVSFFLFVISFLNFYPVGEKIKTVISSTLKGQGCNPDFDQIHMEWLLPKIIISDLRIPSACLNRLGESLKFNHLTINYNFISFAPFGLPFRIDTEFGGQSLSLYYVIGLNKQVIRLKDQKLNLTRLQPLLGENLKLSGNVVADMSLGMSQNLMTNLSVKAHSKDLQIPPQNVQGLMTPSIKVNEFYLEASTEGQRSLKIEKLLIGDIDSPVRANFKGKINLQNEAIGMSPLDLRGEVAFSENFRQSLPLVDMLFQTYNQKDGFYQIRLGGTLNSPQPISL
jgi:type II secretion system protein N